MKVIFATPTMGNVVCKDFHESSIRTAVLLTQRGIAFDYVTRNGDPYLAKVRNELLTDFLEFHPDATDLFFIDSDVGFPAEKVIEFAERQEGFMGGVYPKKTDKPDFPVQIGGNPTTGELAEKDGLLLAKIVPTGFLRLKRHVVEQLAKDAIRYKGEGDNNTVREYYNVFETGIGPDGVFWGEDYALCMKWLRMGGEIWADPDIRFTHQGAAKWTGRLADHLPKYREHIRSLMRATAE